MISKPAAHAPRSSRSSSCSAGEEAIGSPAYKKRVRPTYIYAAPLLLRYLMQYLPPQALPKFNLALKRLPTRPQAVSASIDKNSVGFCLLCTRGWSESLDATLIPGAAPSPIDTLPFQILWSRDELLYVS